MSFIDQIKESFLNEFASVSDALPNLAIGVLGFIFIWFIARRVQSILTNLLTKRMDDPLLASFLARMLKVAIITGGFLFLLKMIGWGDAAMGIMATAGVGAFVIGFALRDIGENFLAGIVMAFQRPFGIGDTIEVTGIVGTIVGLSLRETHVKTFDGKDVFIPNGIILKNPLFNYTVDGFLRKQVIIKLKYGSDIEKAIQLVTNEVISTKGVLKSPKAPTISISNIDLTGLELIILFWFNTDAPISGTDIKKEIIKKSVGILQRNDFKFSSPIGTYMDR